MRGSKNRLAKRSTDGDILYALRFTRSLRYSCPVTIPTPHDNTVPGGSAMTSFGESAHDVGIGGGTHKPCEKVIECFVRYVDTRDSKAVGWGDDSKVLVEDSEHDGVWTWRDVVDSGFGEE